MFGKLGKQFDVKENRRVGLLPCFEHFYHHSSYTQGLEAEDLVHPWWFLFRD